MIKSLIPPPGPPRALALAQLICRTGDGAYYICAALYFTRIVGLSPVQMGLGLTVAWSVALVASVPLGHLADRKGPRGTAVVLFIGAGLGVSAYLFVSSFTAFAVSACVYAVCQRGGSAAQQALLAGLTPKDQVTRVRAHVQASYNAGLAVGAGLGGLALLFDRREAYYAVFVVNALAFGVAAIVLSRLPAVPPVPVPVPVPDKAQVAGVPAPGTAPISTPVSTPASTPTSVFKDRPYIVLTVLNTLLLLHIPLVDIALPLWISRHTAAPTWLLSLMFMLNTVAVVLFQVRISQGVTGLQSASRYVFLGSVLLAAGCVVFAFTGSSESAWVAGGLLLTAAAIQAVGEMMQAAGSWELSFGLAPEGKHGQYQAFFGNGTTVAEMIGPLALTGLIVYWGAPGWILLGGLFVAAAAALRPVVRWGERVRSADPATVVEASASASQGSVNT
ncbi:MFS transporter [Streptomyces sp. AP-93]|uniref:MFS transporter n=1 Tax=Streptomyces sp. AP-93 TaxID=2929048 RepID=UPI001FAF3338|nr:MFS transporter [Streptomyces sp. AP-93]MCJ0873386.1 MFS transporter [Streptomyces sp. AP-93]